MAKTIIGLDPGSPNFGATVFKVRNTEDTISTVVKKTGILPQTLANLEHIEKKKKGIVYESFGTELNKFDTQVCKILDEFSPKLVGIERFQGRGLRGNLSELVNYMISVWLTRCKDRNIPCRLVTPLSWKTQYDKQNRLRSLNSVYSSARIYGLENHCLDSYLIGLYCYSLEYNVNNIFSHLLDNVEFEKILEQMSKTYSD